jgi:DNA modification methylase
MGEGEHSRRAHVIRLRLGDCIVLLQQLDPETIGAVVTDPPYG